jgi:glycosidase
LKQPAHRELFDHYRQLIALRRSTPALRHSSRSQARAWAEGNVLTLTRSHEEEQVVILYNVGDSEEIAVLPPAPSSWSDLATPNALPERDGVVTLDPWSYRVFRSTVTG